MRKIEFTTTRVEATRYVGRTKFGDVSDLTLRIGDENFNYLVSSGIIYQGKNHPDVWRITEKGKRRSKALSSRVTRFITWALWNLGMLS